METEGNTCSLTCQSVSLDSRQVILSVDVSYRAACIGLRGQNLIIGTIARVGKEVRHVEKGQTAACFVPGEWSIQRADPHGPETEDETLPRCRNELPKEYIFAEFEELFLLGEASPSEAGMALAEGSLVLALLERLQLASKGHTIRIGVSGTSTVLARCLADLCSRAGLRLETVDSLQKKIDTTEPGLDIIFDTETNTHQYWHKIQLLAKGGTYVLLGLLARSLADPWDKADMFSCPVLGRTLIGPATGRRLNLSIVPISRELRQKSLTEFSQLAGLQAGCWPPVSASRKLSDLARAQLPASTTMPEMGPATA